MVDTGACTTLIAESVVSKLNLTVKKEQRKELKTINKYVISVNTVCRCSVGIGGLKLDAKCYIVPDKYKMPASLVLGIDFLKENYLELGIK